MDKPYRSVLFFGILPYVMVSVFTAPAFSLFSWKVLAAAGIIALPVKTCRTARRFCRPARCFVANRQVIARGPIYSINPSSVNNKQPYIEVKNATYHGSGPREEARAMCSVKTQEVNATANATITRRLHGVVSSRELHSSIARLEVIIYGQMQQLWQSLDALRTQIAGSSRVSYPDRRSISFRYKPGAL